MLRNRKVDYLITVFVISFVALSSFLIQLNKERIIAEENKTLQIIDKYCNDFKNIVNYSINSDNKFIFEFKNVPSDDKIEEIKLSFKIDEIDIESSLGQEINFERTLNLPITQPTISIDSPFAFDKGTYVGSDKLKFSSTIYIFFENELCFYNLFKNREINILNKTPSSFVDISRTFIPKFYIDKLTLDSEWNQIYNIFSDVSSEVRSHYDEITKNALFLQFHDWDYETNQWIPQVSNRLKSPVRIGLFGDFTDAEISSVAIFIEVMRDIAPELDIKFTSNSKDVTLYIHKGPCDNSFITINDCSGYAGYFISNFYNEKLKPNHGTIWILETAPSVEHVIIHELGHAFGLNHNNCDDSIVSSLNWTLGYQYETLQPIDIATLFAIYNNDFEYSAPNFLNTNTVEILREPPPIDFSYFTEHKIPWHVCNFDFNVYEKSITKLDEIFVKLGTFIENN